MQTEDTVQPRTLTRRTVLKAAAALAGTVTPLSACAQASGSRNGKPVLTMWSWSAPDVLRAGFDSAKKTFPSRFRNVEFSTQLFDDSVDVAQHLALRIAAHEPLPDVVMLNYLGVPELAAADVLADLGEIVNPVRDDLYEGARTVVAYRGKTIAVPYELKSKLFYYRDDLFQKAGIDPAGLRTVEDFIDAAHRFHTKFPKQYMIGTSPVLDNGETGEIMSAFPNGRFADQSGNYELTTNPCFSKTLSFQKQLKDSEIGLPIESFSADWPAAIKAGRICGFMTAQWMKVYLPEYAGAEQAHRWKARPWPALAPLPDQRYGSDQGGAVWVVPKGAPNQQLAIEYLHSALLDPKGSVPFFQATAQAPLLRSAQGNTMDYLAHKRKPDGTSRNEWLQLPQNFFGLDYYPTEFDSYNYARTFAFDPNASIENDMLNTAASSAYTGQTKISDALESAQNAMKNQIGNPYLA